MSWKTRVQFPGGKGVFLFATASRTTHGPTQPTGGSFSGRKAVGAWTWPRTSI